MTSSGLFLATIYNQSQLAERKYMARYWSINTAVTAVPLIAHPSPIEVAAATTNGCSINRAALSHWRGSRQNWRRPYWAGGCLEEMFCQPNTAPVGSTGQVLLCCMQFSLLDLQHVYFMLHVFVLLMNNNAVLFTETRAKCVWTMAW